MRTTKELRAEAAELEKKVKGGKLTGQKLKKTKARIQALRYHAKRRDNAGSKVQPKSSKKASAKKSSGGGVQMQLPNFLSQMQNARIEELASEAVNQALQRAISKGVDAALAKVIPLKKAK